MGLKMEARMLIDEKGGNAVSASAKDKKREVCEATSEKQCNKLLDQGWGILAVVPGGYLYGVVYVMFRTVK